MSYTKKQQIYAKYMLKQIGMSNEDFIEGYLKHLEVLYAEMIPEQNKTTGWVSWKHTVNNCIERLKEEIQLKKNRHNIKYKKLTDKIAATDLANYIYCPVSYSISKTFEIETFGNGINLAALGQNFHEQVRLINRFTNKEDENLSTASYSKSEPP